MNTLLILGQYYYSKKHKMYLRTCFYCTVASKFDQTNPADFTFNLHLSDKLLSNSFQRPLKLSTIFFTRNKRHLNPLDNNCDPSVFKKEMFPRVKQKPEIPEDYFSLPPQTHINTAVFTFCTLYRSIPLQSTTNLCCSRDKNRVGK